MHHRVNSIWQWNIHCMYIKIEVEIFERHTTESKFPFHITCYIDLTQPKARKEK